MYTEQVRREIKPPSMAYLGLLRNNCTKNYWNQATNYRTRLGGTLFFANSVLWENVTSPTKPDVHNHIALPRT